MNNRVRMADAIAMHPLLMKIRSDLADSYLGSVPDQPKSKLSKQLEERKRIERSKLRYRNPFGSVYISPLPPNVSISCRTIEPLSV